MKKGMVNHMSFTDLLNQDLPSRRNTFFDESVDDDFDVIDSILEGFFDETGDPSDDEMGMEKPDKGKKYDDDVEPPEDESKIKITEGLDFDDDDDDDDDWDDDDINDLISGTDDDDDDDDITDLSDSDLEDLDSQLSGKIIDDVVGPENPEKLSPDEEMQADDMMSVAATTAIINDEMNTDEKKNFIESQRDVQIAINEGLLLESDVHDIADASFLNESKYGNKMVIRLDKNSKMKQLYAIGVNVSAAAHKDPDYYKYKKVNRMKKILQTKLRKKYHAEALKRMRVYMKRLTSSKSKPLSDLGKKITKGKK